MKMKRCFVLVELCVVLLVLTVFAAMMVSMLDKIRCRGEETVCASNLKKLGAAMGAYCADSQDFMPYALLGTDIKTQDITWDDLLGGGYDGRKMTLTEQLATSIGINDDSLYSDLYYCPGGNLKNIGSAAARSYSINGRTVNREGMSGVGWSSKIGRIKNPQTFLALTERISEVNYLGEGSCCFATCPDDQTKTNPLPHTGKGNYLFADWHVELLDSKDTIGGGSLKDARGMWSKTVEGR